MNGPIAQAAALVVYGNEFLRGRAWNMFWPGANVFKYCKRVRFLESPSAAPSAPLFAADPAAWFAAVKAQQMRGLRLHYVARSNAIGNDRELAVFVGGAGRWLIEAVATAGSSLWEARWVAGPKDANGAVWDVDYACIAHHWERAPAADKSLEAMRTDLQATLTAIAAFAKRNDLASFAKAFESAKSCLDAPDPVGKAWGGDFEHTSLLPLTAQQLIGAANAAWVFGGMGSWNDQGFEGADQQEYTNLSDTLFAQLCEAICAAVNAGSAAPSR